MALAAKAISADYGAAVDVVPGAAAAMTGVAGDGGKKVTIPAIGEAGGKYLTYLRGYIGHEAGHVRFTEDGVADGLAPLGRHLWNIFEGCFVGRRMPRAFIGCGAGLRRLALEVFGKGGGLEAGMMPGLAVGYCLIRARAVDVPALGSRAKACGGRPDARLRPLLQAAALNRGGGFRRGRPDCNKLHRLAVNNARVFASRVEKASLDTGIGMVAGMPGSMPGGKAAAASRPLSAAMPSLRKLPVSVRSFAVGFSGGATVGILDPHGPLRIQMRIAPGGGAPCGEGAVRALMEFVPGSGSGKVISILADGRAGNEGYFRLIIGRCAAHGVGLYGFGICGGGLRGFMPPARWRRVDDVKALPAAMSGMLRQAFGV